jgi:ABC-type multidrug transport system fused ATPase/permease subunit
LAPLPLVAGLMWTSGRRIHATSTTVQDAFGALSEAQRATLAAARAVKGAGREAAEAGRLAGVNAKHLAAVRDQAAASAPLEPAVGLVAGLSWLLALWGGGDAVLTGRMPLGDFVAFIAYLALLTWPMLAVGWVVNIAARGRAGMDRITAVLDTAPAADGDAALPPGAPALELDRVAFTWPAAARPALDGVSAAIPAGGMLGVIAPTAGGKSTLLRLLLRLDAPSAGTIRLGGVPLDALAAAALHGAAALVPHAPDVFALSVRDNVRFAAPDADDGAVRAALAATQLDRDVDGFPAGLDTAVGERGVTLSGGQRQRLGLARALLTAPRLLVLDDCLSAVDTATEAAVLAELRRRRTGMTLVVAAHRVAAVREADLILVLDHGRVVEQGTHADLMAANGLYARLAALQALEQAS